MIEVHPVIYRSVVGLPEAGKFMKNPLWGTYYLLNSDGNTVDLPNEQDFGGLAN